VRPRMTMITTAATISATPTTAPMAMPTMAPKLSPPEDGQLVQPITEYVPTQVRPLTDAVAVTVVPPSEHARVVGEPPSKVTVEPKEDAVPVAQEHPETRAGKSVMAPEAEVAMV
jgi:hypothetical protein